jgi:hypothetical protein
LGSNLTEYVALFRRVTGSAVKKDEEEEEKKRRRTNRIS